MGVCKTAKSMGRETSKAENERRIRAGVRVALSSGVWLAIGVQVLILSLFLYRIIPMLGADESQAELPVLMLLFLVLLVVNVYVMGGILRAFAIGAAIVSARETLTRGKEVFSRLLWLSIKALLLVLGSLYLLGIIVQLIAAAMHAEPRLMLMNIAPGLFGLIAIIPFVLIYWLPVVFVRNDFRIFPTLQSALQINWQRLAKSGFLAFLVFLPLVVLWLLPRGTPFVIALVVSVCRELMWWTAYAYCVALVTENPDWHRAAT